MAEQEVDWQGLSAAARVDPTKQIYRILRALHKQQGGAFADLFVEAQNAPLPDVSEPYSNIKRGQYDRHKVAAMHDWLARNHFDFAQAMAPDLFQHRRTSDWQLFLDSYTVPGGLEVIPAQQMGIASRALPSGEIALFRLGQPFLLKLTAAQPCYGLGFEEYVGTWHPLALGAHDRSFRVKLKQGSNILPRDGQDRPIPLREFEDPDYHEFALVLCMGPKPPEDRAALIHYANSHPVQIHRARTKIV